MLARIFTQNPGLSDKKKLNVIRDGKGDDGGYVYVTWLFLDGAFGGSWCIPNLDPQHLDTARDEEEGSPMWRMREYRKNLLAVAQDTWIPMATPPCISEQRSKYFYFHLDIDCKVPFQKRLTTVHGGYLFGTPWLTKLVHIVQKTMKQLFPDEYKVEEYTDRKGKKRHRHLWSDKIRLRVAARRPTAIWAGDKVPIDEDYIQRVTLDMRKNTRRLISMSMDDAEGEGVETADAKEGVRKPMSWDDVERFAAEGHFDDSQSAPPDDDDGSTTDKCSKAADEGIPGYDGIWPDDVRKRESKELDPLDPGVVDLVEDERRVPLVKEGIHFVGNCVLDVPAMLYFVSCLRKNLTEELIKCGYYDGKDVDVTHPSEWPDNLVYTLCGLRMLFCGKSTKCPMCEDLKRDGVRGSCGKDVCFNGRIYASSRYAPIGEWDSAGSLDGPETLKLRGITPDLQPSIKNLIQKYEHTKHSWTTKANKPVELKRSQTMPKGWSKMTEEQKMERLDKEAANIDDMAGAIKQFILQTAEDRGKADQEIQRRGISAAYYALCKYSIRADGYTGCNVRVVELSDMPPPEDPIPRKADGCPETKKSRYFRGARLANDIRYMLKTWKNTGIGDSPWWHIDDARISQLANQVVSRYSVRDDSVMSTTMRHPFLNMPVGEVFVVADKTGYDTLPKVSMIRFMLRNTATCGNTQKNKHNCGAKIFFSLWPSGHMVQYCTCRGTGVKDRHHGIPCSKLFMTWSAKNKDGKIVHTSSKKAIACMLDKTFTDELFRVAAQAVLAVGKKYDNTKQIQDGKTVMTGAIDALSLAASETTGAASKQTKTKGGGGGGPAPDEVPCYKNNFCRYYRLVRDRNDLTVAGKCRVLHGVGPGIDSYWYPQRKDKTVIQRAAIVALTTQRQIGERHLGTLDKKAQRQVWKQQVEAKTAELYDKLARRQEIARKMHIIRCINMPLDETMVCLPTDEDIVAFAKGTNKVHMLPTELLLGKRKRRDLMDP